MPDWTFRIWGTAAALSDEELRDVESEVSRLQSVIATLPGYPAVRARHNPSGPLGDYVRLLMDAVARGASPETVLPMAVQQQYADRRWFALSREVLDAFTRQLLDQQASIRKQPARRIPRLSNLWQRLHQSTSR